MPDHTKAADRSHGGPGSSHENGDVKSARTRKGDRTATSGQTDTASGEPHGDAHGHHAEPDEAAKANHKATHGGKP